MLRVAVLAAVCAALTAAAPLSHSHSHNSKPQGRAAAYFNHAFTAHELAMCQPYYDQIDQAGNQAQHKRANAPATLCPFTYNQYQLVTDLLPQSNATAACNSVGLLWAGVDTVSDTINISALLDDCGGSLANIAYYQGIYPAGQPDVCAYASNDQLIDFMGAPNICNTAPAMVLCSAIATATISTDTTTTTTPTSTSVIQTDTTLVITSLSFSLTTTSFAFTTNSVRTLTSTEWSPVVVTVISTTVSTSTSISGTVTVTVTSTGVFTTSTTISAVKVVTLTQTVLATCPGQRLDTCPCRPGKGGFVLVENPLPYYQARCACESIGLDFAEITDRNIDNARKVIETCVDCKKSAWISSWEQVNNDECLALYADGNIAIPENCNHRRPVLCKVVDHNWSSSSCSSSASEYHHRHHKAATPEDPKCGCPESSSSSSSGCPVCDSTSSSSSSCGYPPTCDSSSSSSCGCPCPPTCESTSSSSSSCGCPCPPTCESTSSSSCGCPCPPTCESTSSSSSGCPCIPVCESSSSSSSSCGCPCPPSSSSSSDCNCHHWTSESCSSLSEWEACDQCQVVCCDRHLLNKNPFAAPQSPASPNPNLLKSRTINESAQKLQQLTVSLCVQPLGDYAVNLAVDTQANQEIACAGAGGYLADLADVDSADLAILFSNCNLSNGAYFNSWDQLEADPCGFVYGIPGVFGYVRFLTNSSSCDIPRAAICKFGTTSTVAFGPVTPLTTSTTTVSTSISSVTTTIFTTQVTTITSLTTSQTTFVIPVITTNINTTSTSVSLRTSPSTTTLRSTFTSVAVATVNTTVTAPTTSTTFTSTKVSTSTSFTSTTSTTVTVTLVGKRK